jgi:tetratricopeptide (TPR) repeat protein
MAIFFHRSFCLPFAVLACVAGVPAPAPAQQRATPPAAGVSASTASLARAADFLRHGQPQEAEKLLSALVKAEPGSAAAWNLLGAALDEQDKHEQAQVAFDQAARLAPRSASVWNNLGNHYVACGNPAKALDSFRKVLALDPAHPNANLQLARIAVDRKDGAEALRRLAVLPDSESMGAAVALLRARALSMNGRKAESLLILDRLEKSADSPAAWYSIGLALAEQSEFVRAEALLARAVEAEPANSDFLYSLGLAALRANHPQRAQQVAEAGLRIRPADPEFLFLIGRALAAQKRFDDAILALVQARKLAPGRADILRFLAETSAQAGFVGDAALLFDEYLKLKPGDEFARFQRGMAYASAGKKQEAAKDLEWYASRHPSDPAGHFGLGFSVTTIDPERAFDQLDKAIQLRPNYVEAHAIRGALYQRQGRPAEAVSDLEYVARESPDDVEALDLLGQAFLSLDRPADAAKVLQAAYQRSPDNPKILMHLGNALRNSGREEEGDRLLKKLADVGPDRVGERLAPGTISFLFLSPEEQRARYESNLRSLLKSRGTDYALQSKLARLLMGDGRTEEALSSYRQILAGQADSDVLLGCARELMQFHNYELALQFQRKVIATNPSPAAWLDLTVATAGISGPGAALQELHNTPADGRNSDYYLLEAQLLDKLGRMQDAVVSLNHAIDLAPDRADLYQSATMFLFKNRKEQAALGMLELATKRLPDDMDLQLLKAVVLGLSKRVDEARELLGQISRRWPEWSRPYLVRGIIEESNSRSDEALQDIGTAMTLGDRSAEAYLYLAMALNHARPAESVQAMDAVRRAMELSPGDPWAKILAGRLSIEAGSFENAERYLKEAIKLQDDLAQAHFWLGSTYRAMGRMPEAEAEMAKMEKIRELNPRAEENEGGGVRDKLFSVGQ